MQNSEFWAKDPHVKKAQVLFGVKDPREVTKEQRARAKSENFLLFYSQGFDFAKWEAWIDKQISDL